MHSVALKSIAYFAAEVLRLLFFDSEVSNVPVEGPLTLMPACTVPS